MWRPPDACCAGPRRATFGVAQCVTLEALEAMSEEERLACLLPVDALLERHTLSCWMPRMPGGF
jgi:hypothetical protein